MSRPTDWLTMDGSTRLAAWGSTMARMVCPRVSPMASPASVWPRSIDRMPARKIPANAAALDTESGTTSFQNSGRSTPYLGSANSTT